MGLGHSQILLSSVGPRLSLLWTVSDCCNHILAGHEENMLPSIIHEYAKMTIRLANSFMQIEHTYMFTLSIQINIYPRDHSHPARQAHRNPVTDRCAYILYT